MSKRNDAIEIMKANATLPMRDVVALIADRIGVTDANAKSYYRWIVTNGKAPGVIEKSERAAKAVSTKAPKVKAIKPQKFPKVLMTDKKKVTDKTVEELEDIKNKNLARLKAVHKKYMKGQVAEPRVSDEPFDESAVPTLEAELESFKAPAFLSKDDVKALV